MQRINSEGKQGRKLHTLLLRLILLVCAAMLLIAAWIRFRPQPALHDVAASAASDFYAGNASSLIKLVPDYELRQMGISRDQGEKFLKEVILPKVAGCKILKVLAKQTSHVMLGIEVYEVQLPDKRTFKWTTGIEISDTGPIYFIHRALQEAWRVEYLKSHSTMSSSGSEAVLWGLEKDQVTFEAYGVHRLPGQHEERPGITYEDAFRQLREAVGRSHPTSNVRYIKTKDGNWIQVPVESR